MSELHEYGLIGVFDNPEALKAAARHLRRSGFRAVEAYSPYPVEGLNEILHPGPAWRWRLLPLVIFGAAVLAACWGYFIQWWDEALNYPINVGGRPLNSWPAFIVGTVQFTLLVTIAACTFVLLLGCRLPRLYHPIFNADAFGRASVDRFVLCVEARDQGFDPEYLRRIFERHGAEHVAEVPAP
jgi:Alternative complex III, ActD subunit